MCWSQGAGKPPPDSPLRTLETTSSEVSSLKAHAVAVNAALTWGSQLQARDSCGSVPLCRPAYDRTRGLVQREAASTSAAGTCLGTAGMSNVGAGGVGLGGSAVTAPRRRPGAPPTGQRVFCWCDVMFLGQTAPEGHLNIYIFLQNYKASIKAFLDLPGLAQAWESVVLVGFRRLDAFADLGYQQQTKKLSQSIVFSSSSMLV